MRTPTQTYVWLQSDARERANDHRHEHVAVRVEDFAVPLHEHEQVHKLCQLVALVANDLWSVLVG
jgi:hypothetical protein